MHNNSSGFAGIWHCAGQELPPGHTEYSWNHEKAIGMQTAGALVDFTSRAGWLAGWLDGLMARLLSGLLAGSFPACLPARLIACLPVWMTAYWLSVDL